jgi:hypothetical protein
MGITADATESVRLKALQAEKDALQDRVTEPVDTQASPRGLSQVIRIGHLHALQCGGLQGDGLLLAACTG